VSTNYITALDIFTADQKLGD